MNLLKSGEQHFIKAIDKINMVFVVLGKLVELWMSVVTSNSLNVNEHYPSPLPPVMSFVLL